MRKCLASNPVVNDEMEQDETELFQRCTDQAKVTSLSSHIGAVRKCLSTPGITDEQQSAPPGMELEHDGGVALEHLLALPAQSELQSLVDLYFEYMHYFFPCVDEGEFRAQLSVTCHTSATSRCQQERARSMSPTFVMLLYVILAIGTCLDPQSQKSPSNTVVRRQYLEIAHEISRRRQDTCGGVARIGLLRYQTALAVCLIHIERPTAAYRAVGDAVQQAFVCGLNDESGWSCTTEGEARSRRLLWWTIFYLDRRIAQKCWKPYLIRETEVCVGKEGGLSVGAEVDADLVPCTEQPTLVDQYARENIRWAKLWAAVWDALFSAKAARLGTSTEDIEVLDARILHAQRQVPSSLRWNTDCAETYAAAVELEVHVRSRLVIYVVSAFHCSLMGLLRGWPR